MNWKFNNGYLTQELEEIMGYDEVTVKMDTLGSIEVNDKAYHYADPEKRYQDYRKLRQALAIKKVTDYSWSDERRSLEEHIGDELGDEAIETANDMTDLELYNKYHDKIDHIWFWLYDLHGMNPYPEK
jgi:hypothetical protein